MTWCKLTDGHGYCLSCNKRVECSPIPECTEMEHSRYYTERLLRNRRWRDEARKLVIMLLGGGCKCCGYDLLSTEVQGHAFLEIDHVKGGAGKSRRLGLEPKNLTTLLAKGLINQADYRVLCAACNQSMEPGQSVCELHRWEREFCQTKRSL